MNNPERSDARTRFEDDSAYRHPISESDLVIVEKVFAALDKTRLRNFEPTAIPVIKLHLYNFFANHADMDEEELQKEINKCKRWSEMEKEHGEENNPLPTIGIEIEILKENLTPDKVAVLRELGIPNHEEFNSSSIWEVNPDFSSSPWLQGRVIQELAAMGVLPLQEAIGSRYGRVPAQRILSLHINLGWPRVITYKISHCNNIETLSDTLNYAFTSTKRIRQLKVFPYNLKQSKKSSSGKNNEVFFRLELKAPEFRNYPSYRMLAETQKLSAMLFSYIKKAENLPLSQTEKKLADLWFNFNGEVSEQFKEYGIEPGELNEKPEEAIRVLETTDLKQKSREISSRYARRVGRHITGISAFV